MKHKFHVGDIVEHFKRELISEEEQKTNKYLYQIINFAQHTENGEFLVIYQALYADFKVYASPVDRLLSKVDKKWVDKYPQLDGKDRFSLYKGSCITNHIEGRN